MNAVEASRKHTHHGSAAYRTDLSVSGDPLAVLRFNSSVCTEEYRDALLDDSGAMLEAAGFEAYGEAIERTGLLDRDDYVLTPEEEALFIDIRDRLYEGGLLTQEEFERQLAQDGYGLPAIVVVLVVVVVAVVVAVAVK